MLAVAAALLMWSRSAPTWWVYSATALVGLGYAGVQVFPLAMLPDAAAVDAKRTGDNRAGVYTGVWTAGETLGLALGPALFALVLAIGGYHSSNLDVSDWTTQHQPELGGDRDRARLLADPVRARAGQPAAARRASHLTADDLETTP